jgi:hypothetical protein
MTAWEQAKVPGKKPIREKKVRNNETKSTYGGRGSGSGCSGLVDAG